MRSAPLRFSLIFDAAGFVSSNRLARRGKVRRVGLSSGAAASGLSAIEEPYVKIACMKHRKLLAVVLVLLCPAFLDAQRGRRGGPAGSTISAPPLKGVIITTHGTLKQLTKKAVLIQADDDRIMNFRRSGKTRFLRDGQPAKASDFDLESKITVDAVEDNDLKLLAIAIKADPLQKKDPPFEAH